MHVNRKTGLPGFQKKLLCTAITLSLLPISGAVLAQDDDDEVEEIIITASGGPFLNMTENKLKNVKIEIITLNSSLEFKSNSNIIIIRK